MPNGRGMGFGFRGGMGFGFRGSSPPWPFIGRGRGGLPRCGYFLSGAASSPVGSPYSQTPYPVGPQFSTWQNAYPFHGQGAGYPGPVPYGPQMTAEQELDSLASQAKAIKGQLEQIDARMRELEGDE